MQGKLESSKRSQQALSGMRDGLLPSHFLVANPIWWCASEKKTCPLQVFASVRGEKRLCWDWF